MCRRCFPSATARPGTPWIQWLFVGHSSQGDRTQSFKLTQGQHLCVQPLARFTSSCFFNAIFNCTMCRINIVPFVPCRSKQDVHFFSPGHSARRWQGRVKADRDFCLIFCPSLAWAPWALPLQALGGPRWFPNLFSLCCITPLSGAHFLKFSFFRKVQF